MHASKINNILNIYNDVDSKYWSNQNYDVIKLGGWLNLHMRYGCVYPCMRYCFIKINNTLKNVKQM